MENLLLVLVSLLFFLSISVTYGQPLAPALYVFGDSKTDSGNNNLMQTVFKANFFPYGLDFTTGPTGRFTNGKTEADFIAQLLGLPFVPPYFSTPPAERLKTLTGFNYASGGAGIQEDTNTQLGSIVPLPKQVDAFVSTVNVELSAQLNPVERFKHLSQAIFFVYIGTNDYAGNYLQPPPYTTTAFYSPPQFAQDLVQRLFFQLRRLYGLGARKFVVFGQPPIGCTPNQIKTHPESDGRCVDRVNEIVAEYNKQIAPQITILRLALPGSTFVYGDVNTTVTDIIQNPSKYGFTVTNSPCCVAGQNGTGLCIAGQKPCTNRNQYVFFDGLHTTQAIKEIVATRCFNQGTCECTPINIQQLAQL